MSPKKVGMNLTATSLFTFSQLCREWNRSNIVQPYLDVLQVSRVDVLEIGGPPNSTLVDEITKLTGSFFCVIQRTGHDLHRGSDARKVAEWVLKHRPGVAWFRIPCCWTSQGETIDP